MDAMREKDGLLRLIVLLAAQADSGLYHPPSEEYKNYDTEKNNIILVPVEGDMRIGGQATFFVGKPLEVLVDQVKASDEDEKDEGNDAIEQGMVFLVGLGSVCRGIRSCYGFSIALDVCKDRIDVGIGEIGKDIHRRAAVRIVQVVEVSVAGGEDFAVVMNPVVQESSIRHA